MGCKILVARKEDGAVSGRAIIWPKLEDTKNPGVYYTVLDRCYANDNAIKAKMKGYAKGLDWDVRQNDDPDCNHFISGRIYRIPCARVERIPWMDSLHYFEGEFLYNSDNENNWRYSCRNTDGTNISLFTCPICGKKHDTNSAVNFKSSYVCRNCVVRSNAESKYLLKSTAVFMENLGDWKSAGNDNYQQVDGLWYAAHKLSFSKTYNRWYLTREARYVEDLKDWIPRGEAVHCPHCGNYVSMTKIVKGKVTCTCTFKIKVETVTA
jgi:transposase-like protein